MLTLTDTQEAIVRFDFWSKSGQPAFTMPGQPNVNVSGEAFIAIKPTKDSTDFHSFEYRLKPLNSGKCQILVESCSLVDGKEVPVSGSFDVVVTDSPASDIEFTVEKIERS